MHAALEVVDVVGCVRHGDPPDRAEFVRRRSPLDAATSRLSRRWSRVLCRAAPPRSRPCSRDREHDDRHTVFPGKREGGGVHDLRSLSIASWWVSRVVALGLGVLLRIGGVDAVDIGGLEHGLGVQLGGAQHRGGVGGEDTDCRCRPPSSTTRPLSRCLERALRL